MDISLATESCDVYPMDHRFRLQTFQSFFQVQIAAAQKVAIDLGRGGRPERSEGPLRTLLLDLRFGKVFPLHPTREKRLGKAPDVLPSLMAHDHHVSAHLHVEEGRGDSASRGPAIGTSLASGMIFKFAQTERSLPQLIQYFLPQSLVLRQPLPGSRLPSSP